MVSVEQADDQLEAGYITDSEGRLIPDYDQTIKIFDDGDVVTGTVVRIDRDEILIDIGYKSEGVIPLKELSIRRDINPGEIVCIGEEVDALVLQKEDKDGRLILSKKRAEYEKSWIRVERLSKEGEIVCGRVIEVVKGGLILDIGLRGFLPASLVDIRRVKDLQQFVGQDLECKVIEMDRNRNNVVLSRRSVLDEARKQEREKVITGLKKNDVLSGKVSSIVDFGAFVDLGGIDGLIHISEISWTHIDHPSEVLNLSEEVTVKVLDVDHERGRISLGLKQCQDDPWKQKVQHIEIDSVIEGQVTKLVPFGAFVCIADGVEGLVHISELAEGHVEVPEQAVKTGQTVVAKVVDIDADRRRISLSIRQATETVVDEADSSDEDQAPATELNTSEEMPAKPKAAEPVDQPGEETVEEPKITAKAGKKAAAKKPAAKVKTENEPVLGSGVDAAELLNAGTTLDEETSAAIDKALKLNAEEEAAALEEKLEEAEETQPADNAGSLEDVLEKMKETRGGKG